MNEFHQPVGLGDVLDVEIETEGDRGDGMAFVDGLVVFVRDANPGEKVTVRIEEVKRNCAFAEVWER